MLRSLLSVVLGFGLFFGALQLLPFVIEKAGADSEASSYLLISVAVTIVAAVLCGMLTGLIAGTHEFPHVATVGMLMIGLSLYTMKGMAISRPGWYQISIAGCGPVSAMFGAGICVFLRVRQSVAAKAKTSGDASLR